MSFNLTISPPQAEFILKPGVTLTQAYDIINNSSQDISLNTEVLPFIPQGDNGSVSYQNILSESHISFSLANANIALGQPFILKANQKTQLVLKIKTSTEINLSDYYHTFFVYQTNPISKPNSTDLISQTTGKIGSHILLSLSNSENTSPTGQIQKFKAFPKIQDVFFGSVKFSGQIYNNSDHFFKTNGQITISKNSQTIKEIKLEKNNVLNHFYRQIKCQESNDCSLLGPFWPGKYTATLNLDSSLKTPPSSTSFWILPLSPIAIILTVTLLIFVFSKIKKAAKR